MVEGFVAKAGFCLLLASLGMVAGYYFGLVSAMTLKALLGVVGW